MVEPGAIGGVSELAQEAVLKTAELRLDVGSNPTAATIVAQRLHAARHRDRALAAPLGAFRLLAILVGVCRIQAKIRRLYANRKPLVAPLGNDATPV